MYRTCDERLAMKSCACRSGVEQAKQVDQKSSQPRSASLLVIVSESLLSAAESFLVRGPLASRSFGGFSGAGFGPLRGRRIYQFCIKRLVAVRNWSANARAGMYGKAGSYDFFLSNYFHWDFDYYEISNQNLQSRSCIPTTTRSKLLVSRIVYTTTRSRYKS